MLFYRYTLLFVFCSWSIILGAASIEGTIKLSDDWAPVVYISEIQSFEYLHTASYDFLRYQVDLDSAGYFEIKDMAVLADDRIYRLHVCKKGDPISTIMIGGQEENFIHFVMNKASDVLVRHLDPSKGLQDCTIIGHPAETQLSALFELKKKLNTPLDLPSAQNRSFVKKQILNDFTFYTDTSSHELIRLLAMHFINESFANIDHLDLMEKMQNDFAGLNTSSPYYDAFVEQLSFLRFQNAKQSGNIYSYLRWVLYLLFIPAIGLLLWWRSRQRPRAAKKSLSQKSHTLSNQEKRVLSLLKKGKSNKEISTELHIEVSTVKSHLNKIYSRLGVKSRKEIINKDL